MVKFSGLTIDGLLPSKAEGAEPTLVYLGDGTYEFGGSA